MAFLNDMDCIIYTIAEPSPYTGVAFCTLLDTVLAFNVITADEELAPLATAILSSIMVADETEPVTE